MKAVLPAVALLAVSALLFGAGVVTLGETHNPADTGVGVALLALGAIFAAAGYFLFVRNLLRRKKRRARR